MGKLRLFEKLEFGKSFKDKGFFKKIKFEDRDFEKLCENGNLKIKFKKMKI